MMDTDGFDFVASVICPECGETMTLIIGKQARTATVTCRCKRMRYKSTRKNGSVEFVAMSVGTKGSRENE